MTMHIESELIKLHRPLLNGRASIFGDLVKVVGESGRGKAISSENYRLKAIRESRGYEARQGEMMADALAG